MNIGPVYHGTSTNIESFDESRVKAGFHFGTIEQAKAKGSIIIPAILNINKLWRSIDQNGAEAWKKEIEIAKEHGCDGVVYLNRFEGLLVEAGPTLYLNPGHSYKGVDKGLSDGAPKLTDEEFKKAVPEASDSYIAFYSVQITRIGHPLVIALSRQT